MLDDYTSVLRHAGIAAAARMWVGAPRGTGDARVDAAFAAMAEYLARRDGWTVPSWARLPEREAWRGGSSLTCAAFTRAPWWSRLPRSAAAASSSPTGRSSAHERRPRAGGHPRAPGRPVRGSSKSGPTTTQLISSGKRTERRAPGQGRRRARLAGFSPRRQALRCPCRTTRRESPARRRGRLEGPGRVSG